MMSGKVVRTLMRSDFVRHKWLIAALSGAAAVACVSTLPFVLSVWCTGRCRSKVYDIENLFHTLLAMLCMTFVVAVIQGDSPTERTAYWRSQPVNGTTLFISKVLFVVGVPLSLAIVSQSVWLVANGLSVFDSSYAVLMTAYWIVSLSLCSALIASITSGKQAFVLAAIGYMLLRLVEMSGLLQVRLLIGFVNWLSSGVRADLWLVAAIAGFWWIYRSSRAKNVGLVALMITGLVLLWDSGTANGFGLFTRRLAPPSSVASQFAGSVLRVDSTVRVRIQAPAPPNGRRYRMVALQAGANYAGTVQSVSHTLARAAITFEPDFTPGPTMEPKAVGSIGATVSAELSFKLPARPPNVANDSLLGVELFAFVVEETVDTLFRVALSDSASAGAGTARVRVTRIPNSTAGAQFQLALLQVGVKPVNVIQPGPRGGWRNPWREYNTAHWPAIALEYFAVSGSSQSAHKLQAISLGRFAVPSPVPLAEFTHEQYALQAYCAEGTTFPCSAEWWADKQLMVAEWRYKAHRPILLYIKAQGSR